MLSREEWALRVREEETKIIDAEGVFYVRGRYYANSGCAGLQRRWEAEVRASRAIANEILRRRAAEEAARIEASRRRVELTAVDMSDRAAEKAKRAELYAIDPTCSHCGHAISQLNHAVAVHFNASGEWKLYHEMPVGFCAASEIMLENERLAGRCAWCDTEFVDGDYRVEAACREIHATPCAAEYGGFTTPANRDLQFDKGPVESPVESPVIASGRRVA